MTYHSIRYHDVSCVPPCPEPFQQVVGFGYRVFPAIGVGDLPQMLDRRGVDHADLEAAATGNLGPKDVYMISRGA